MIEPKSRGVLDTPLSRGMTTVGGGDVTLVSSCRRATHRARIRALAFRVAGLLFAISMAGTLAKEAAKGEKTACEERNASGAL
jgi:hypothetical protein